MTKKLVEKVALVTGASKGIGAAIALKFAEEGAAVVVNYSSSREGAQRVVDEIVRHGGRAIAVKANITDQGEMKKLFSEAIKAFGKLDILVNNAGVYEFASIEEITPEHFHKMFHLNVFALLFATQEAVKLFGPSGGSVINMSSIASTITMADASVYSATKAAVDAITKCLSKELGPRNIRVNAINPGFVETEGIHAAGLGEGELRKTFESETPLGRLGKPEDIAAAAVFFASDDASWITGETLIIAGGFQ